MPILQDNLTPPAAQPMPQGAPAPAQQGQETPHNPAVTSPAVQSHMDEVAAMRAKMTPEQGDAYDRVVLAGKRLMYSPDMGETIAKIMDVGDVPLEDKIGQNIAGLIFLMDTQANGSMPKDIVIPAGVALMMEVSDTLFESGMEITEEVLAGALTSMIYEIYANYNIPKEQVDEAIDKLAGQLGFKDDDKGVVETAAEAAAEAGGDADSADEAAETEGFAQGFNKVRGV